MAQELYLDQAIQARINGYSIIPLRGGDITSEDFKKPSTSWEKYQKEFATITDIRKWREDTPNGMFGIVTGKLSKLFVLDIDSEEAFVKIKDKLTGCLIIKTNKGYHIYFKWIPELDNKVTTKVSVLPNIDFRGEGGYVVGWDLTTLVPSAQLSIPPKWLSDLLPTKGEIRKELKDENWVVEALKSLQLGNRNQTFTSIAGRMWRKGLTKDEIRSFLTPYANQVNFTVYELETILNSIQKYPQNEKIEIKSFKDSINAYKEKISKRGKFESPELSTGFMQLDRATWGLRRGDLLTIGARTGIGKTCLCISISANLCKQGKKVIYVSTEMQYDEIFDRFISVDSNIKAFNLSNGQLSDLDKSNLNDFYKRCKLYDFHIFDGLEPRLDSVKDLMIEIKPDVLFFDHIQHIASGDNVVRELERFTKGLKQLAKEFNCAIVVASQLNRSIEHEEGIKLPQLHHLKGCGSIEEESSQVLLLSRANTNDEEEIESVMLNLAKNRHGKTSFFELKLNKPFVRFEEI